MEAENSSLIKEESKTKDIDEMPEQDGPQHFCLFCKDCSKIPEYTIEIEKNKIILKHNCKDEENEKIFHSEIKCSIPSEYDCCICLKKCNSLCIECQKHICLNCEKKHIPTEKPPFFKRYIIKDNTKKSRYIWPYDEIQFICKTHFLQYEYFCPICRINLCYHCRNYHVHINCYSLLDYQIEIKNKSNSIPYPDELIKNLTNLCKLFDECYKYAVKKGNISINIILNYSLIDKIYFFISKYINKKAKKTNKIANTLLNNEQESNHLCIKFL